MWPESKGKGGKDGSSKSKDGGEDGTKPGTSGSPSGGKSGGKGRSTKTKMKALAAETAAQDPSAAAAKLEQDIIAAAQGQQQSEATKTLIETNRVPEGAETGTSSSLMRLPAQTSDNLDEKISSLWKNKVLGAYRANPRASQHILPAMPNNRGALEITEKARADAQHAAMVQLVDKMFDRFQNLAFEFNSVATPELELTWIRPILSRENISSWHQAAQIVSVFTGRISTRYWTMVVRGTPDSVLSYVIPADKLLTFSNQPANFQPVIELVPMADGLTVRWSVFGRLVSHDDLHHVFRALLDNMIRIAQDDAPCDRFIDLGAYGVYLEGEPVPAQPFDQAPSQVMGQAIDYSAKYQQQFGRPPAGAAPAGAPQAPAPAPAASAFDDSSSADWKPVVHAVRGANPPVPATPMPGQNPPPPQPQGLPTTPGFNQDEPWRNAGPVPQPNASGNSLGGVGGNPFARPNQAMFPQSGSQGQSFGGRPPGLSPGDANDEPPLPPLPAHLFEGLPPRPQAPQAPGPAPGMRPQSVDTAWPTPPMQSAPALSSVDDGWKSADIPVTKGMQPLPPLPVSGGQTASGVSYDSVSAPQSVNRSFTSGSIRVDALAREIAHSPVSLPPAVPGFEPYSVDDGKPQASQPSFGAPLPSPAFGAPFPAPIPATPEPAPAALDADDLADDDDDLDRLPWPKPRAPVSEEAAVEPPPLPPPPQVGPDLLSPQLLGELPPSPVRPSASPLETAYRPGSEQEITEPDPEQNAFITFDGGEADAPSSVSGPAPIDEPDVNDPEIVALFEGEPVNSRPAAASPWGAPPGMEVQTPIPQPEPNTAQESPPQGEPPQPVAPVSQITASESARAAIEAGFRAAQQAAAMQTGDAEPVMPLVASFDEPPQVVPEHLPAVAAGLHSINADITRLLTNLDIELEVVSNKGSEAFARRDLKGAERMIKLAEKLSEFKESLLKLQQDHGADLS
ncbi:MAG: hypothetical protein JSS83_03265 [Cyanobacteria bacterium SZAS LIN-3]|nr:hypothetical protein [Cyanobacteria bacterium SZAS LIN-3]